MPMSMLDAFFAKGFKGAKCKTLLKLTIPRIKLLRNRREIQLKQMRRDIAKLLETGQEATARIRVEHIVREENMMAAQEIIELFCELIVVRLPIIETQKDCPLDLKEAIATLCFASPRCSDLPELQQIQMLFAGKYGKEFLSAALELMPDCGVNRQVIELLSVTAPTPETKLKLLKEIAEEHELDWDPAVTEAEFFKSHEDLLNGPTMFIDGSKLPLPEEKHTLPIDSASSKAPASTNETDLDSAIDSLDLPQVPSIPVKPPSGSMEKPELTILQSSNSFVTEADELRKDENSGSVLDNYNSNSQADKQEESIHGAGEEKLLSSVSVESKDRQFLPFMSPPTSSSSSVPIKEKEPSQTISSTSRIMTIAHLDLQDVLAAAPNAAVTAERSATSQPISGTLKMTTDAHVDLQDVLAAARNAAETAERAAAAARSAVSLAEVRISEIIKKRDSLSSENSGSGEYEATNLNNTSDVNDPTISSRATFDRNQSFVDRTDVPYSPQGAANLDQLSPKPSSSDLPKVDHEVGSNSGEGRMEYPPSHLPRRLSSLEEDSYFSYPNLFTSANAKSVNESENSSQSTHS